MTSFSLPKNELNMKVARAIKERNREYVEVEVHEGRIEVRFPKGLVIHRSDIDVLSGVDLTDQEWTTLIKEMRKTLNGAKIFYDKKIVEIAPTKSRAVCVRFDPIDLGLIKEAAKLENMTISEFIRTAVVEKADRTFNEKGKKEMRAERESITYVS